MCTQIAICLGEANLIVMNERESGANWRAPLAGNAMTANAAIAAGTSALLHSSKPTDIPIAETANDAVLK